MVRGGIGRRNGEAWTMRPRHACATGEADVSFFEYVQWLRVDQLDRCRASPRTRSGNRLYLDMRWGPGDGFDAWCGQRCDPLRDGDRGAA
jgi:4-alpha-glucanotransferase